MNRQAALDYLTQEFRELADDAQFQGTEQTEAYNAAIDNSLRQLGYEESALLTAEVAQGNVTRYIALLEYFALRRFAKVLAPRVSVSLPGPASAQLNQAFSHVQALLDVAKAEVAAFGVDPGGAASFQLGRMTLDFLEPSSEVL